MLHYKSEEQMQQLYVEPIQRMGDILVPHFLRRDEPLIISLHIRSM